MNNEQLTADGDRIAAVILAAGASRRMGQLKKEFQKLKNGKTALDTAASSFASVPSVEIIVIAVNEGAEISAREALSPRMLCAEKPRILFVNGGESRRASVFCALSLLSSHNPRYVLIHDGARPWVSVSLIENIIEAVKKHGAAIPLLPLTETPKETDAVNERLSAEDGCGAFFVRRHLKRACIGLAQTPQAFAFPEILRAHEKAASEAGFLPESEEFTDDAEIWSRFAAETDCRPVAVVPGDPANKKITFPEDLN